MSPKPAGSFGALAIPDYRILFIGTLGSFTAFFMSTVLQGIVAFNLTGTNTAVGSAVFGQGLGMLLFGPIGGAYADRLPKRRVIAIGQLVSATVFTSLGCLYALDRLVLSHLVIGAFLVGTSFAMLGPARQALAVDLVPDTMRGNAMALNNVANTMSRVMGPFLASIILAAIWAGPAVAYWTIGGLYLVSASMLVMLPRSIVRDDVSDTHVLQDLTEGLQYVWHHPRLRRYLLFFVAVMLLGFPHVTLMPGLVENVLGRPAKDVTDFYLASAGGALLASLQVARFADSSRAPLIYSIMAVAFGVSLMGLAAAPTYVAAVVCMVIVGGASGAFHALNGAVIAREAEPVYMGRVMSLSLMAFAGFSLSALPLGILADEFSERPVLFGMGVAVLLLAAWMTIAEMRASKGVGDDVVVAGPR